LYLNIEIFSVGEDEFTFMLMEVNDDYMRLSSTLKNSSFISWIKDRSGKYVDVNKQCEIKMNKSKSEIVGKSDYELFDKELADKITKEDKKVMKENKTYTYEERDLYDNETNKYYQVAKWVYTDKNNNTLGTVGISIEITDKIKLRKNLENNEKNFLDIAEHIEEVFFIRDREKMLYISPSFEKVFGDSPDKLYKDADRFSEYIDGEEFEKARINGFDEVFDSILRLRTFKDKWIWAKFVPIKDENGKVIKRVGIVSDITKKKELERELDNLRMDFFANLSHEFRTPINLILSCVQVLNLKLDNLDRETQEYYSKYINILNQNSLRLLKLVNNLIDTTKLDAGNYNYNPKNYDVISFVENICMSVSEFVERNNLSIIFDTDCEEKEIAFDLAYMERIILNLISNAIKFNKPKGKIEVNINCENNIKISVKDTGVGIPQEKLESVFGRFEQVNKKLTTEQEGSGIGLSLVKSLVEIQNGTITLNSKIGEGSEFIITLPDILVENKVSDESATKYTIENVNIMDVEFSDIYY
ncbi:MAG: PAS domain-containing sensor histidine kinase, partial [Peptostreptococcaceae bacterium]